MKIGAVLNKSSGTLSLEEKKRRIDKLEQHLKNRVSDGYLAIVNGPEVEKEVKRLITRGIDLLVIGGGDGTISTGARHVTGTDIPLLALALGTKNNFTSDAGVFMDPEKALQLLDNMRTRIIDVGEVNDHIFINNATIGLYPAMVKEREEKTDLHGWPKWRARIAASFVVMRRLPLMRMTIQSKEFKIKLFTPFLFVGNNEYENITNSDFMRPSLEEGKLWLCMAQSPRIWAMIKMVGQLSINGIKNTDNLDTHLLTEVQVKPRKRSVLVAIDGENIRLSTPLRFHTRKKSLQIIVP